MVDVITYIDDLPEKTEIDGSERVWLLDGSDDYNAQIGNHRVLSSLQRVQKVYNNSGSTIDKHKLLYRTGWDATQNQATVDLADKAAASSLAEGIALEDINNGSSGLMLVDGIAQGDTTDVINTGTLAHKQDLYLGTNGDWLSSAPGTGEVQNFGFVGRVDSIYGSIYLKF